MYPVSSILERARYLFPERTAVVDGDRSYTYAELAERVDRLAGALRELGLIAGDRVAILDNNTHRYLEAYYACAKAGFVFMPLNTRLAPRELDYILADSDARAILYSEPFAELFSSINREQASLEFGIGMDLAGRPNGIVDFEEVLQAAEPFTSPVSSEPSDIVLIYYTSGTTGEPKGVCLTNDNLYAAGLDPIVILKIEKEDKFLHLAPLFHLAGAWGVWAFPLTGACQLVAQFEPRAALSLIERERVTMTALPGAIIAMVANMAASESADLSSLRTIIYGGSPTPFGVLERAAQVFPPALTHVYGITETAGFVTTLPPDEHVFQGDPAAVKRTISAGQSSPLIDIAIRDDDGELLGPHEVGEIVCGGPKIMQRYWQKPEQTAAALKDGWYHTGDLGYLDERGYLFVVDRKKDMIISGGENVYSVEVETVLSTHPRVMEVAVIGLPDEKWGEAVTGIIVPKFGQSVTPEELIEHCRGKIGGYKIPRSFHFRADPLPKTGPGKIAKRTLRDEYMDQ